MHRPTEHPWAFPDSEIHFVILNLYRICFCRFYTWVRLWSSNIFPSKGHPPEAGVSSQTTLVHLCGQTVFSYAHRENFLYPFSCQQTLRQLPSLGYVNYPDFITQCTHEPKYRISIICKIIVNIKNKSEAGDKLKTKMAREDSWVGTKACLGLCEDLAFILSTHVKQPGMVVCPFPCTGKLGQAGSGPAD